MTSKKMTPTDLRIQYHVDTGHYPGNGQMGESLMSDDYRFDKEYMKCLEEKLLRLWK